MDLDLFSQAIALVKDYWWGVFVLIGMVGAFVHNDKLYANGYAFGSKFKGSPYLTLFQLSCKGLAQLTGGVAAWLSGASNGFEGKPLLGEEEKTQSRKIEE